MARSILAAVDIENRTSSGKRRLEATCHAAAFLGQRLNARIELLYVEDIKTYPHDKDDQARIKAWHVQHQERLEETGRTFPVSALCSLKTGSPAEQILKTLRSRTSPELVIMATRGRRGLKRLLIGSVAEEVIRHSRRPVMVIGPTAQEKEQKFNNQKQLKFLVATDLGKNSRAAERYALSLAKRTGAAIVLFHCLGESFRTIVRDGSMLTGWVAFNFDEILGKIRETTVQTLEQKVRFFEKQGVACYYKIDDKSPMSSCAIYEEGERGFSLVVMGTHGRSAVLGAYFGSTARETILSASIPVVTVHSGR